MGIASRSTLISTWQAIPAHGFPATAREINDAVPVEAVRLLAGLIRELAGLRVVILGAAYRPGVKATAFSGVFPIAAELSRHGAVPVVHDPLYTSAELADVGLEPYCIGEPCDAAILHTGHSDYAALTPADLPGVRAVIDGRAITDARAWERVPRMVLGVGTAGESAAVPTQRPGRHASNYHSVGLTAGDDSTGAYHDA